MFTLYFQLFHNQHEFKAIFLRKKIKTLIFKGQNFITFSLNLNFKYYLLWKLIAIVNTFRMCKRKYAKNVSNLQKKTLLTLKSVSASVCNMLRIKKIKSTIDKHKSSRKTSNRRMAFLVKTIMLTKLPAMPTNKMAQ